MDRFFQRRARFQRHAERALRWAFAVAWLVAAIALALASPGA